MFDVCFTGVLLQVTPVLTEGCVSMTEGVVGMSNTLIHRFQGVFFLWTTAQHYCVMQTLSLTVVSGIDFTVQRTHTHTHTHAHARSHTHTHTHMAVMGTLVGNEHYTEEQCTPKGCCWLEVPVCHTR